MFGQGTSDPDVVAVVNGEPIYRNTFYTYLENDIVNGERRGDFVLRQMISELLILQAGRERGFDPSAEVLEAEIEALRAEYGEAFEAQLAREGLTLDRLRHEIRLSLIQEEFMRELVLVSDEDVAMVFEANKDLLGVPDQYRVLHIQVDTEEEALALRTQLADGADFRALAAEHSLDTNVELGLVSQLDPLPAGVIEAIVALQPGEVSQPIELPWGFHLFRVDEVIPGEEAQLADYEDQIRLLLMYELFQVEEVLAPLWDEAAIQVNWERYQHLGSATGPEVFGEGLSTEGMGANE